MQDDGILDCNDERDLYALHYVFLPVIQASFDEFVRQWNNHGLRTVNSVSFKRLTNPRIRNRNLYQLYA